MLVLFSPGVRDLRLQCVARIRNLLLCAELARERLRSGVRGFAGS
jgi:hypothetical protein